MLGGVPFKGKFVVFFKHDESNDEFVKTLVDGKKDTKLSEIKNNLIGAYALTSNRKKIKLLNKSGIFKKILNYVADKLFKKPEFKLKIKEQIINDSKANNEPVDEKQIESKLATMNIKDELNKTMKDELTQIENGINLDNAAEYIKLDNLLDSNEEFVARGINSYIIIDKGGNLFKDYTILKKYNSSVFKQVIDLNEFETNINEDVNLQADINSFKTENNGDEIEEVELIGGDQADLFMSISKCKGNPFCIIGKAIVNIILFCIYIFLGSFCLVTLCFLDSTQGGKRRRRRRY